MTTLPSKRACQYSARRSISIQLSAGEPENGELERDARWLRPGQAANMKDLLLDVLIGVAAGAAAVTGTVTVTSGVAHMGDGGPGGRLLSLGR
jgi:hypothetical protein